LNRVFNELTDTQNKYESIKKYTDEVKMNLDAARKESHEHISKIEELIKEKIQLANELNNVAYYNKREGDVIGEQENITSAFYSASQVDTSKSEIKDDIDEKLQGILSKCIISLSYINRQEIRTQTTSR